MGIKLPQRFVDKMKRLLGSEFEAFIASYEQPRKYGLRVNGLKLSGDAFSRLSPFGERLSPIPWAEGAYYYEESDRPGKQPYYHAGLYYIQEPSAMVPAELLGVRPGDRVLDLCAAPGGKSTQLAAKLQGRGVLVANDNARERTKALAKNIELAGVRNAIVLNEEPAALAGVFEGWFDRILVDAPCSGEGMFRKDESMAAEWERHSVERCSAMQRDILRHAVRMLAPGGTLVYSTCTFSPEENEVQIAELLAANPEMEIVPVPLAFGWAPGRPDWAESDERQGENACGDKGHTAGVNGDVDGTQDARDGTAAAGQEGADIRDECAAAGCAPDAPVISADEAGCSRHSPAAYAALAGTVRLWPHLTQGEGHYAAVLRKRTASVPADDEKPCDRAGKGASEEGLEPDAKQKPERREGGRQADKGHRRGEKTLGSSADRRGQNDRRGRSDRLQRRSDAAGAPDAAQAWSRFAAGHLVGAESWPGEPVVFGSRVYLQPSGLPSLDGLRVVRAGWYLGDAGPHRFEPSQPLAMGLRPKEAALTLRLRADEDATLRYLKGETLHIDASRLDGSADYGGGWSEIQTDRETGGQAGGMSGSRKASKIAGQTAVKGYVLVCADDFPIGWGKIGGDGLLKNELPPGWRMM